MKRTTRILTLCLAMLLPFCANARKEKGTADVYVFGVGTSFNDSVMYMSAPQRLD